MAKVATTVKVSLRDVEPVKSFIASMTEIRNDQEFPVLFRDRMDVSFRQLYHGFASTRSVVTESMLISRGWKIPKADVGHPDREKWPSVLIVIPVFNSPALLKQCLVSLMRTSYPGDVMYSLVDNASTDPETLKILAGQDFTPIRFDEPVGFATAVKAGMKIPVDADYYVLFNQDCRVVEEDWLTGLINWMELRPACAVAGPKLIYPTGRRIQQAGIEVPKGTIGRHRYVGLDPDDESVNYYEKVQAVTGAVFAIRGSAIPELGQLDEAFQFSCEDTAYCIRAGCLGYEVWYVPDSVVIHHESAVRRANVGSERIRTWTRQSETKFHSEYGPFVALCDGGSAAFVLSRWNPDKAECQSAVALADAFVNAGLESTIYLMHGDLPDVPMLASLKPVSDLEYCDILVVVSPETAGAGRDVCASRRFYLAREFDELATSSYQQSEYEIVVSDAALVEKFAEIGRTARVMDGSRAALRGMAGASV